MDLEAIKACVRHGRFVYSLHAEWKRKAHDLSLAQIREALLGSEILEQYPDTGRGESCLVVGFSGETPIHIVCGWLGERLVLITVYLPGPPRFIDPWERGGKGDE